MESFPPGEVTNYGITLLQEGTEPTITYVSPDGDLAFYLNGGLAPWPGVTEGVVLKDGIQGLHPPFNHLDHKGARQAGVSWAATVYDPGEIDMQVIATARTPENYRKVVRKWIAAWDPEKRGTLSWVTPDGGEWWCYPRLFRAPPDRLRRTNARMREQTFSWTIRNDDAFWRSHDSVGQFNFGYTTIRDTFNRDDSGTLGSPWDQDYSGGVAGVCETDDTRAVWTPSGSSARTVINRWQGVDEQQVVTVLGSPTTFRLIFAGQTTSAISHPASAATVQTALEALSNIAPGDVSVSGASGGPYTVTFIGTYAKLDVATMTGTTSGGTNAYVTVASTVEGKPATTGSDIQIIRARFGDFHTFPLPGTSYVDLWGRMNSSSTDGIRLRIGLTELTLSRFNGGVETVMKTRPLALAPFWWETWSLLCGTVNNSRHYKVLRNGFPIMFFRETGTGSSLGASYRYGGFGMTAGTSGGSQAVPPSVFEWAMDDNTAATQSGHVSVTNFGTQDAYPDLVVYGPGTFVFGDGPGVAPTITFGPLTDGQVALLKTHPGQRGVYDITADTSEQDLPFYQDFLRRVISLTFNNNTPPLFDWFRSALGITPPQVYMYPLLQGRFTQPVPGRPVGDLPETSQIAVQIQGGNGESKVVAALTPLCRWPE